MAEQQNKSSSFYKKMRKYMDPNIEKGALRYQVAQVLDRWDNQDFRVDINWTEFESLIMQERHLQIVDTFQRHLEFKNTGSLPMRITSLLIDDVSCERLMDPANHLRIENCLELLSADAIQPMEMVDIVISYRERFDYTRTSKTLTIDTEQFQQKFFIDFLIPERA